MDPPQVLDDTDNIVSDLILKTGKCSCVDLQIELCPPTRTHPPLNLIVKIISNRNFLASVVLDIILKVWRPHRPVLVKKVDRNIFLFTFEHEIDLKLAFDRRPWTLKGAHLVLKKWRPELTWQEVDFSSSTFWVQVHGLPSLWHDKANLLRIGNRIGKVLDVDLVGDAPPIWHRFTRLRIEIDISAPLISGMFLHRSDLNKLWLALKYERLPEICYNCGIIGHDSKVCNLSHVMILNQFGFKFLAFGDWLRSENALLPNGIYEKTFGTIESGTNKEFRDVALATDNSGTGQGTGEPNAALQAKGPTLSPLLMDQVHAECGTSSALHAQQTNSEHIEKSLPHKGKESLVEDSPVIALGSPASNLDPSYDRIDQSRVRDVGTVQPTHLLVSVYSRLHVEISSFAKLLVISLQNDEGTQRTRLESEDKLNCQNVCTLDATEVSTELTVIHAGPPLVDNTFIKPDMCLNSQNQSNHLSKPIEETWPNISQSPNLSLVVPDTYVPNSINTNRPTHIPSPNTHTYTITNPPIQSLKRKTPQIEENQIPKKPKLSLPSKEAVDLNLDEEPISPRVKIVHNLKSEHTRKNYKADSFKLFPQHAKSYGYFSEAVSSGAEPQPRVGGL
jgi:hypothetical protein